MVKVGLMDIERRRKAQTANESLKSILRPGKGRQGHPLHGRLDSWIAGV